MPVIGERVLFSGIVGALTLALAACSGGIGKAGSSPGIADAPPPVHSMAGWRTTADGSERLVPIEAAPIPLADREVADVLVNSHLRYQTFVGYGAAITDASAWLLAHELDDAARAQLLQELFGEGGLRLDVARITIGASDFSLSHYTYADRPNVSEADIAPARSELIPVLGAIRALNPKLTIIASPWSAPAWMKTSGSLIKGRLDPAHYEDFSHYLVSYLQQMRLAGVHINYLTIQNEPHFEPGDYPGMRVNPAERAAFIGQFLGPAMKRQTPDTRLLDWDHNWDEPESPLGVLADKKAADFVDGVAWHCYAGNVSAQTLVHDQFPVKETWFTECSAGEWSGEWSSAFEWVARNLVIGAPKNWARGVVMWNLVLDQDHGPHHGGCGNCRGLVTIDTRTGEIEREPEYYAFAHGSRFLPVEPIRVDAKANLADVEALAFVGRQDGTLQVIILNANPRDRDISIDIDGRVYQARLPPGSLGTFVTRIAAQ